MDDGDMIEVEVYKEKEEHWKGGSRQKHQKDISIKGKKKKKKREKGE